MHPGKLPSRLVLQRLHFTPVRNHREASSTSSCIFFCTGIIAAQTAHIVCTWWQCGCFCTCGNISIPLSQALPPFNSIFSRGVIYAYWLAVIRLTFQWLIGARVWSPCFLFLLRCSPDLAVSHGGGAVETPSVRWMILAVQNCDKSNQIRRRNT